ncbi:hypothetical protein ColTof4_14345 [Colletotrichum tofieldiae]|nr:hypothetical protein ColTof3_14756 [Colletotrichum tofieldiae]GKT81922.1 hypothetical protein ColTof4_14345 [Colletotrichum tofieldiae]
MPDHNDNAPHDSYRVSEPHDTAPAPNHPRDGYSVLRFSIAFSRQVVARLSSQSRPGAGADPVQTPYEDLDAGTDAGVATAAIDTDPADFTLQPIELCFHEPFLPTPTHPLSLHVHDNHVQLYAVAPVLSAPSPPHYMVEYDPVYLCDPSQANHATSRYCCQGSPPEQGDMDADADSDMDVGAAAAGARVRLVADGTARVVLCGCVLLVLTVALVGFLLPAYTPLSPSVFGLHAAEVCPGVPARIRHAAVNMTLFDELLDVADAWAEIPRGPPPSKRVVGLGEASSVAEAEGLVDQVTDGVMRIWPRDLSVFKTVHRLSKAISETASEARKQHRHTDVKLYPSVLWIQEIASRLDGAQRRLRSLSVHETTITALFSSGFDPALRHFVADATTGRAVWSALPDQSKTMHDILDIYSAIFSAEGFGQDVCSFFDRCGTSSTQVNSFHRFHPICQVSALLLDPRVQGDHGGQHGPIALFLERWRDAQRDDELLLDNSFWQTTKEPDIVSLARRTMTLASDVLALLAEVGKLGLWDPLSNDGSAPPLLLPHKQQAAADVRLAATRLHASPIFPLELAAIHAVASAKALCNRLAVAKSMVQDLRDGFGWADITFEDSPLLEGTQGRQCVKPPHNVLITHRVLPHPQVQADMLETLQSRVTAVAKEIVADVSRQCDAVRNGAAAREKEREQTAETIAGKLGVDSSTLLDWGLPFTEDVDAEGAETTEVTEQEATNMDRVKSSLKASVGFLWGRIRNSR